MILNRNEAQVLSDSTYIKTVYSRHNGREKYLIMELSFLNIVNININENSLSLREVPNVSFSLVEECSGVLIIEIIKRVSEQ